MKPDDRKTKDALKFAGLAAAGGLGAFAIYRLTQGARPCTHGETKCVGYDLYTCVDGTWVLTEENAAECGLDPEMWFGDNEALAKKTFVIAMDFGGWVGGNEPMAEKSFRLIINDAGWVGSTEPMAQKNFSLIIVPQWVPLIRA